MKMLKKHETQQVTMQPSRGNDTCTRMNVVLNSVNFIFFFHHPPPSSYFAFSYIDISQN